MESQFTAWSEQFEWTKAHESDFTSLNINIKI